MTGRQLDHTPPPNHSMGPRTPEGKSRCRLNACRIGLTGRLCVLTPQEQQAFEKHCKIALEAIPGLGHVDAAFRPIRTWEKTTHNLQLLTVCEQRIQRAVDKNMAPAQDSSNRAQGVTAEAMEQFKILYQLAQALASYRSEIYETNPFSC